MALRSNGAAAWRGSWRPLLLILAIAECTVLIGIERERLGEVRSVEQRLGLITRTEQRLYDPRLDPKVGHRLPDIQLTDAAGRRVLAPRGLGMGRAVLVFLGECAPCGANALRSWQSAMQPGLPVYAITESDPADVVDFRRRFHITVPFLFDSRDAPPTAYHVTWRPRAYVLDRSGRLLYLQRRLEPVDLACKRVLALADRGLSGSVERARASRGGAL